MLERDDISLDYPTWTLFWQRVMSTNTNCHRPTFTVDFWYYLPFSPPVHLIALMLPHKHAYTHTRGHHSFDQIENITHTQHFHLRSSMSLCSCAHEYTHLSCLSRNQCTCVCLWLVAYSKVWANLRVHEWSDPRCLLSSDCPLTDTWVLFGIFPQATGCFVIPYIANHCKEMWRADFDNCRIVPSTKSPRLRRESNSPIWTAESREVERCSDVSLKDQ